ncbi:MAG: hypothetical protein J3R72DRAFT_488539 [Linnemannia gamsii]|nr:MAG: hypothetical protein J3R72DRAFT_488539 [Linnemannia gamsii]
MEIRVGFIILLPTAGGSGSAYRSGKAGNIDSLWISKSGSITSPASSSPLNTSSIAPWPQKDLVHLLAQNLAFEIAQVHRRAFTRTNTRPLENPFESESFLFGLKIHDSINVEYTPGRLLHDYLCSPSYLLYLKALYTPYSLDHMNLHRLMHLIASPRHRYGLHVSISRIWLLPLRTRQGIDRPAPLPEQSRITFGYIVRVCPKLREIKMSNDDSSTGTPISTWLFWEVSACWADFST